MGTCSSECRFLSADKKLSQGDWAPHQSFYPCSETWRQNPFHVHSCTTSSATGRIQTGFSAVFESDQDESEIRNGIQCTDQPGSLLWCQQQQWWRSEKELAKLQKDPKNKDFLDQIYYALAGLAKKEGKPDEEFDNLNKSVRASTTNQNQKALSYLELAKIYFQTGLPQCSGLLRQYCRESFQWSSGLYWCTQPTKQSYQTGKESEYHRDGRQFTGTCQYDWCTTTSACWRKDSREEEEAKQKNRKRNKLTRSLVKPDRKK